MGELGIEGSIILKWTLDSVDWMHVDSLKLVTVNSSQIFIILYLSLLIRRDFISVSCVYTVKKIMHSTRFVQLSGFYTRV